LKLIGRIDSLYCNSCIQVIGEHTFEILEADSDKFRFDELEIILDCCARSEYIVCKDETLLFYPLSKKFRFASKRILEGSGTKEDINLVLDTLRPYFKDNKNFTRFEQLILALDKIIVVDDLFGIGRYKLIAPFSDYNVYNSSIVRDYAKRITLENLVQNLKRYGATKVVKAYYIENYKGKQIQCILIKGLELFLEIPEVVEKVPDFIKLVEKQGIPIDVSIKRAIENYKQHKQLRTREDEVFAFTLYSTMGPIFVELPEDYEVIQVKIPNELKTFTDKLEAAKFISQHTLVKYKGDFFYNGKLVEDKSEIVDFLFEYKCSEWAWRVSDRQESTI